MGTNTDFRGINHDIRSNDGSTIYMPKWFSGETEGVWGNLALPNIYEATSTQSWPRGTIYREGMRTYVYGKMDSTLGGAYTHAGYVPITYATYKDIGSDGMQAGSASTTACTVNYGEACAVDKYAGGILGFYGTYYGQRYIVAQAVADASYDMVLTLDQAMQGTMATTDEILLHEAIYKTLRLYVTAEYAPYVGVLMHDVIGASEYNWLQTGGPHGMTFYHSSAEGGDAMQFMVVAYHGTTQIHPSNTASAVIGSTESGALQWIGWRSTYTTADMGGGQTIWLSILN